MDYKQRGMLLWFKKHMVIALLIIVFIYGLILSVIGIWDGVYLSQCEWLYNYLNISPSVDNYDISFYASASQDFWFFVVIGIAAAWITSIGKKDAKDDNLTTKVNHFFPEVDPASAHMRFLEKVINENSCIATKISSKLSITTLEEDFYELVVHTSTNLKNIHHNHSIDENNGSFSLFPDEKVLEAKIPWGRVNSFIFESEGVDNKSIVGAEDLAREPFEVDYNIKLGAGNSGRIIANYSMWNDIKEPFEMTPTMFALDYELDFENKTTEKLSIEVICRDRAIRNFDLDINEYLGNLISIKDVKCDEDIISFRLKKVD